MTKQASVIFEVFFPYRPVFDSRNGLCTSCGPVCPWGLQWHSTHSLHRGSLGGGEVAADRALHQLHISCRACVEGFHRDPKKGSIWEQHGKHN